jgi:hypothetical protein
MPSSIKYKKIYIDTKYRSSDSNSASDFKYELPETMSFKEDTVVYLDDIAIPHSWESIIDNINNKLYFKIYEVNEVPARESHLIATIEPGNYTGGDLAAEIQAKMNALAQTASGVANLFTCAFVVKTNKITISVAYSLTPIIWFRIITQEELKTVAWNGTSFDRNKPNDINEILSNLDTVSKIFRYQEPYVSGSINLQPFNNIYIHGSNLCNYNTIGPQNERTILKKVPVSASYNFMIFDQCVLINDYNDCGNNTIKTLYFQLKSSRGDIIPLNGCNWSFSLVFSRANPDV